MLLIGSMSDSIDAYYYKLILATLCSESGYAEEFEDLVQKDCETWEAIYVQATKKEPRKFVEIFRYYLESRHGRSVAQQLINRSYDQLFTMDVREIIAALLDTRHMDIKIRSFVRSALKEKFSDAAWQHLRTDVLNDLKRNTKLTPKFVGAGTSLIGIVRHEVNFYIKKRYADQYAFLNKTGMNVVDENEFSTSMLNIEVLSSGSEYNINFPEVLRVLHELNTSFFRHKLRGDEVLAYDVLSYYKYPVLQSHAEEIGKLFVRAFKVNNATNYIMVTEETNKAFINAGMSEKYDTGRKMLTIMDRVVRSGVRPEEISGYVEQVYVTIARSRPTGGRALFATEQVPNDGRYKTETGYKKPEDHLPIRTVIEGAMALHHLFMYLSAHKLNIFDLESEIFMDKRYVYRYNTVEEAIDLHKPTKALMERDEEQELVQSYETNQLPTNDEVIEIIAMADSVKGSNQFIPIDSAWSCLGDSKKNRGGRRDHVNSIYDTFREVYEVVQEANRKFDSLGYNMVLGGIELRIQYDKFVANVAKKQDLVTAMNIAQLKSKGVQADLACQMDSETGYFKTPSEPFLHYCFNNEKIAGLVAFFHSQPIESPDAIIEVYRNCAFYISMFSLFENATRDLKQLETNFNVGSTGLHMGFFDAFEFTTNNYLLCTLRSRDPIDVITEITERMGTELFITRDIPLPEIYRQLKKVYDLFVNVLYAAFLGRMEELLDVYYTDFANKIGGGIPLTGDETFFETVCRAVELERFVLETPEFLAFQRECTHTMRGLLKHKGRLVEKMYDGCRMFLHERGMWIGKKGDTFKSVRAHDSEFSGGFQS